MAFTTLDLCVEKYHGIRLTTVHGAREQYEKKASEMRARIADDAKAFVPRSVEGRQSLARGRYAGRLMHTFSHQVPEQHALDEVMKLVQTDLDHVMIGKVWWITKELARQRREDGGVGHLHLPHHMQAVWANELRRCLEPDARPWKNFVAYYLRREYGAALSHGKQLLTTNMSFCTLTELPDGLITERARQAFKAFGSLPRLQAHQKRTRGGNEEAQGAERERLQQAATPAREHDVVYHVVKPGTDVRHGVRVPAPPPAASVTLAGQLLAHKCGNSTRYSLATTTSAAVAFSDAAWPCRDQTAPTADRVGTIVAVRAELVQGTQHDVSDKGARERSGLSAGTPTERHATDGKRIVYVGEGAVDAYIPPEAILGELRAGTLSTCAPKKGMTKKQHLKAVPSQTLAALDDFARDALCACKQQQEEEGARDALERRSAAHVQRAWRRAELERQGLFHNPLLRPSAAMAARGNSYTEGLAITWAASGVSKLRDVLAANRKRVLTTDEFAKKHPRLPDARPIYEKLVEAMPREWHAALARGGDACDGEHTWWRARDGTYIETWVSQEEKDQGKTRVVTHERESGTQRLREASVQRYTRKPAGATECSVRAVRLNAKASPTPTGGDTRDMRRARDEELAHEILCEDCEHAPLRLDEVALQPPGGLTPRHVVPMQSLTVRRDREMRNAPNVIIPTAWDSRDEKGWRHYVRLYAHLTGSDYAAKMRSVFRALRHPAVPPYMHDVLYKTAVSGHRMGPHKFSKKKNSDATPDEALCHRCGARGSTGWSGPEETLEHAFHACLEVARLWMMVITNWNESTHEQLDPADERTTLLGDRGTDTRAVTEEAWRVVHACTQWVIHTTRCASHAAKGGSKEYLKAPAMMRVVRRKVQELVSARWRAALRAKDTRAFKEAWCDTGTALLLRDGSVRACALSRTVGRTRAPRATDADREPAVVLYTDGAWAPDDGEFEAGAGVAELELVQNSPDQASEGDDLFDLRQIGTDRSTPPAVLGRLTHVWSGPVETGRPHPPDCIGALKQSNNTGELTALYRALLRAAGRASDAPPEDILTDSLYARNVTLGVWRGKRRRHELMIRHLRRLWMQIQAKRGRGTVRIQHVRSHIGVPGNELADRVAGAAMRNANAVANAKPGQAPTLVQIDLDWARAQMRAMTGSNRLQPPPSTPPSTPSSTSYTHPRAGDG